MCDLVYDGLMEKLISTKKKKKKKGCHCNLPFVNVPFSIQLPHKSTSSLTSHTVHLYKTPTIGSAPQESHYDWKISIDYGIKQ